MLFVRSEDYSVPWLDGVEGKLLQVIRHVKLRPALKQTEQDQERWKLLPDMLPTLMLAYESCWSEAATWHRRCNSPFSFWTVMVSGSFFVIWGTSGVSGQEIVRAMNKTGQEHKPRNDTEWIPKNTTAEARPRLLIPSTQLCPLWHTGSAKSGSFYWWKQHYNHGSIFWKNSRPVWEWGNVQ